MAKSPKPAEGSWTEHHPELGAGLVSYADSISPEAYELERAAIFGRTWLHVGRVEQLARPGSYCSYFTKEPGPHRMFSTPGIRPWELPPVRP